jgi:hypothetical protein
MLAIARRAPEFVRACARVKSRSRVKVSPERGAEHALYETMHPKELTQ